MPGVLSACERVIGLLCLKCVLDIFLDSFSILSHLLDFWSSFYFV